MAFPKRAHLRDISPSFRPLYDSPPPDSLLLLELLSQLPKCPDDISTVSRRLSSLADVALQTIVVLRDKVLLFTETEDGDPIIPPIMDIILREQGPSLLSWIVHFIKNTNWTTLPTEDVNPDSAPLAPMLIFCDWILKSMEGRAILHHCTHSAMQHLVSVLFKAQVQGCLRHSDRGVGTVTSIAFTIICNLDVIPSGVITDVLCNFPDSTHSQLLHVIEEFARNPTVDSPVDFAASTLFCFVNRAPHLPQLFTRGYAAKAICRAIIATMTETFSHRQRVRLVVELLALLAWTLCRADTFYPIAFALRSRLLPVIAFTEAMVTHCVRRGEKDSEAVLTLSIRSLRLLISTDSVQCPGILYHSWIFSKRLDTSQHSRLYPDDAPSYNTSSFVRMRAEALFQDPECPFKRCMNEKVVDARSSDSPNLHFLQCHKSVHATPLKICTRCYSFFVCSRRCFKQVWSSHRLRCKEAERRPHEPCQL